MKKIFENQIVNNSLFKRSHDWGLYKNAFFIFGANILPGLFGMVFWWLASRFFSPAQVGIASAIISAGTLIAMISRMGFDNSIVRFLPNSDDQLLFINSVITIVLMICFVFSVGFLILTPVFSPDLMFLRDQPFSVLGFVLLCISLAIVRALKAVYVSKRQAIYSMYSSLISNLSRVLLLVTGKLIGWIGIVGSVTWGMIITIVAGYVYYIPSVIDSYKIRLVLNKNVILQTLPYSLGNFFADTAMQAPITILPLMVLNALGEISNGHAYVALVMGTSLGLPGLALSRSAFAEGANRLDESGKIINNTALVGGGTTLLIAIITFVLAPWLLLLYGQSYADEASNLLRWLAVASPFNALVQTAYTMLRLNNQVKNLVGVSVFNVAITLLVTKIGLPFYGVSAAGMGLLSGNILCLMVIICLRIVDKK